MNLVKKLCTGLFSAALLVTAGAHAQTISVKVTFPKGSAGDTLKLTTQTPSSPCRDPGAGNNVLDAATFSVTYKGTGTGPTALPVYVFLRNHQTGALFAVSKGVMGTAPNQVTLQALAYDSTDPFPATVYNAANPAHFGYENTGSPVIPSFVPASRHINGDQTEDIFGGITSLNGVATGTWQLIGIIPTAASAALFGGVATFSLNNPATWAAFDVATFVLGSPWIHAAGTNCGSI